MKTTDRENIARKAVADALRMRKTAGNSLDESICVYDLAEKLGVEVRFLDIPSMEGMYCNSGKPHIILSSLRPPGRRAFTCAHELGHHSYGDGMQVDELVEQWGRYRRFDPREFAADCFAGALLMPKMAVEKAFALREWPIRECTPDQVYVISNYFGVGYTTLIHHLSIALSLIPRAHADRLLKVKPRQAQTLAIGRGISDTVWIVDRYWTGRPIDVEVGNLVFVHGQPALEGVCVERVEDRKDDMLLRACQPGLGRLEHESGWSVFVRVSRSGFIGRSIFRHLEEVDNNDY